MHACVSHIVAARQIKTRVLGQYLSSEPNTSKPSLARHKFFTTLYWTQTAMPSKAASNANLHTLINQ